MIIAVVGAGGKTTLSYQLGKTLIGMGRRVLFTTTTKIYMPTDTPLYLGPPNDIRSLGLFMTAAKTILDSGKLEGYTAQDIEAIAGLGLFDDIIVEADGAARKPVKAPNETEPVYPASVDLIAGVIGMDCIGRPVSDQYVHRAALFSRITQAELDEPISAVHITRLIGHPEGLFRHALAVVPRVVFLNKCDTMDKTTSLQAEEIIRQSPYPVMLTGYDNYDFSAMYRLFNKGENHAY